MQEAAQHYGITVDRRGFACCPFHEEKTASLKLYDTSFYCFGCGTGGDVITFVAKLYGISNAQAALRINEDFGLRLTDKSSPQARSEYLRKKAEKERELKQFREDYLAKCDEFKSLNKELQTAEGFRSSEITARLEYLEYFFENTSWR